VGAPADVAVLRRTPRDVEFTDGFGARWSGNELLECVMTVSGGEIVYGDAG
jgi:predicted amidohydrolase